MDRELEKSYDEIKNKLYKLTDKKYHVLKTVENKPFKIIQHNDNIRVYPFTEKSTPMTISKNEIEKYLEEGEGNYNSYTPIILEYLEGKKSFDDIEVVNNEYKIEKNEVFQKSKNMKTKNIMLYGAPGVGKTHNYKRLITMIENIENEKTIFDTISKNNTTNNFDNSIFETIKNEKRIEFVTFHQSYSYEDFIEGFRPQDNGNIKLEDGIFKILCDEAKINLLKSFDNKEVLFIDALNLLLKEKIENQENVKIHLKRNNSFYNIYDYNDKTI